jgi:hypothetical protein
MFIQQVLEASQGALLLHLKDSPRESHIVIGVNVDFKV